MTGHRTAGDLDEPFDLPGTTAATRWTTRGAADYALHELFVGPEILGHGAPTILGVLLHEATHALAHETGVQETSRGGRYHNTRFRDLADSLGLDATQVGTIGWSDTTVRPDTLAAYAEVLVNLEDALAASRRLEGPTLRCHPRTWRQTSSRSRRRGR